MLLEYLGVRGAGYPQGVGAEGPVDFQRVFRQAKGNLVLLAPDLTILDANEEWLKITHLAREQVVGRDLFEVLPPNPEAEDQGESFRQSVERTVATGAMDVAGISGYDLSDASGEFEPRFWWPVNMPIVDDDGDVVYILTRADDVTDLVRHDRDGVERLTASWTRQMAELHGLLTERSVQVRQLRRQLQECTTDQADRGFSSSHTLRTPLNAIMGFAQLLRLEPLSDEARSFADQVLVSAEELMALLDDAFGFGTSGSRTPPSSR